jgi:hypothetical protein
VASHIFNTNHSLPSFSYLPTQMMWNCSSSSATCTSTSPTLLYLLPCSRTPPLTLSCTFSGSYPIPTRLHHFMMNSACLHCQSNYPFSYIIYNYPLTLLIIWPLIFNIMYMINTWNIGTQPSNRWDFMKENFSNWDKVVIVAGFGANG